MRALDRTDLRLLLALTDDPRATVVVYSPHEQQDVAVVWVLGLDDSSD